MAPARPERHWPQEVVTNYLAVRPAGRRGEQAFFDVRRFRGSVGGQALVCSSFTVSRVDMTFSAELFEWRGPAPFFWLSLPPEVRDYVRCEAAAATYGWGAIPVCVRIGRTEWETSLLPRNGGYVLPVKKDVRAQERLDDGDRVTVAMSVASRGGRAANSSGPTT